VAIFILQEIRCQLITVKVLRPRIEIMIKMQGIVQLSIKERGGTSRVILQTWMDYIFQGRIQLRLRVGILTKAIIFLWKTLKWKWDQCDQTSAKKIVST